MLEKYATNKNKLADYGRNGNYGSKIGIIRLANLISIGENKLNFLLVWYTVIEEMRVIFSVFFGQWLLPISLLL